jgi:rsbT co-antagonist protein RsbR
MKHATTLRSAGSAGLSDAKTIIARMGLDDATIATVRAMGEWVIPQLDSVIDLFYEWMAKQPEWDVFFRNPDKVQYAQQRQREHWVDLFSAHGFDDAYVQRRVLVGQVHARIGLSLAAYFAGVETSFQIFSAHVHRPDGSPATPEEVRAFAKVLHIDALLVIEAYNAVTQKKIADQAEALMEMSTPVAELWESVLLLPVVGVVDSARAEEIMSAVLRHIADARARVLIIDISGVPVVDTAVADHLIKVTRATRLMGCKTILSGLSPRVAQTIVDLGIDTSSLETTATLRDATARAYRQVGLQLVSSEPA